LSFGFVVTSTQWTLEHGLSFQSAVADDDDGGDDGGDDHGGDDHGSDRGGSSDNGGSGGDSGGDNSGHRDDGTYVPRVAGYREAFDESHLDRMTQLRSSAGQDLGHLEGRYEYAVTETNREQVETSIQSALESQGFEAVSESEVLSVIREVLSSE
jgi:hypothetical protein